MTKLAQAAVVSMTLLAALAAGSSAANARGSSDVMFYVADIAIPPAETGGEQVALCHLAKKWGFFGIPIYYSSVAYVLGPDNCNADNYYTMTPDEFAQARTVGLISADVPVTPSISLAQRIPTLIFGIILILGSIAFVRQQRRARANNP